MISQSIGFLSITLIYDILGLVRLNSLVMLAIVLLCTPERTRLCFILYDYIKVMNEWGINETVCKM